jgi:hypothetical protein
LQNFHWLSYVERSIPTIDHGEDGKRQENAEHLSPKERDSPRKPELRPDYYSRVGKT